MSAPTTGDNAGVLQQEDLKWLLASDEMFNNVTVISEDDGDIEAAMNKALATYDTKDGARGVCALIQLPSGEDEDPGVRLGPMKLGWSIMVLENRFLNGDTSKGGTGKRALTVARRAWRIIKGHTAGGLSKVFTAQKPCIVPTSRQLQVGENSFIPLIGYEVRFSGREGDFIQDTIVLTPTISAPTISTSTGVQIGTVPTTVTLACGTAGASIYYTTDNSHPCSQNSTATLYSAPFSLTTACLLRVRAHKSGSIGSNTTAARFD